MFVCCRSVPLSQLCFNTLSNLWPNMKRFRRLFSSTHPSAVIPTVHLSLPIPLSLVALYERYTIAVHSTRRWFTFIRVNRDAESRVLSDLFFYVNCGVRQWRSQCSHIKVKLVSANLLFRGKVDYILFWMSSGNLGSPAVESLHQCLYMYKDALRAKNASSSIKYFVVTFPSHFYAVSFMKSNMPLVTRRLSPSWNKMLFPWYASLSSCQL